MNKSIFILQIHLDSQNPFKILDSHKPAFITT